MEAFGTHLLTAFALIFVIEGLLYAVFPSHIRNIMRAAIEMDKEKFRYFGAGMIAVGVLLVWVFQKF